MTVCIRCHLQRHIFSGILKNRLRLGAQQHDVAGGDEKLRENRANETNLRDRKADETTISLFNDARIINVVGNGQTLYVGDTEMAGTGTDRELIAAFDVHFFRGRVRIGFQIC